MPCNVVCRKLVMSPLSAVDAALPPHGLHSNFYVGLCCLAPCRARIRFAPPPRRVHALHRITAADRLAAIHTACRRHSFRVRARTRVGAGAFSDETEPLECALSAPAAPTVRALGSSVAELEWEAPDGHGVSELQYVVQVASQAAGAAGDGTPLAEWRDVEHSVVGTAAAERRVVANVRGLRASIVAAYRFRVCAMNNAQCGRGDFSAPSEPLRLPPALPSPPLDVRAEAGRPAHDGPAHVVRIDWKAPADDGGMEIVGYALQSRCEGSAVMWYPVQYTSPSGQYL